MTQDLITNYTLLSQRLYLRIIGINYTGSTVLGLCSYRVRLILLLMKELSTKISSIFYRKPEETINYCQVNKKFNLITFLNPLTLMTNGNSTLVYINLFDKFNYFTCQ